MQYVIKNIIGYVGETADKYWHKVVKTKEEAIKFNSKEEAEKYLNSHFTKKDKMFMTIEEYRGE